MKTGGNKMEIFKPNIKKINNQYELSVSLIDEESEDSVKMTMLFNPRSALKKTDYLYESDKALTTITVMHNIKEIFVADLVNDQNNKCFYVDFVTKDKFNQLIDIDGEAITYKFTDPDLYVFLVKEMNKEFEDNQVKKLIL